jgi:prepilin peptidase CpaA
MNLVQTAPTWLVILLFAILAAAAIEDFIRLRISNITCGAAFVSALIGMGFAGFSLDLWQNVAVFLVLLAAGTLLFSMQWMGGGDVKLLAALGLWVNISAGVWLLATTLLAGGVLAAIYIGVRVARGQPFSKKYQSKGIPYGIAIAVGASLVFAGQYGLLKSSTRQNPLDIRSLG